MKMNTLLIAAALAATIAAPSVASAVPNKCGPIPNLAEGYWFDTTTDKFRVIGYEDGKRSFYVIAQNNKTCKITAKKMNSDAIADKYGLSDELETENSCDGECF